MRHGVYRRRGEGWHVQWKELEVIQRSDGTVDRKWKTRGRTFPSERLAKQHVARVEELASQGQRWEDVRENVVATLRGVALACYLAVKDAGAPVATQRFRGTMMSAWLDFLDAREADDPGGTLLVTELNLDLLERYARSLPSDGRKAQTR